MRKCCMTDDFAAFVVAAFTIGVALEIGVTIAACTYAFLFSDKQSCDAVICACCKLAATSSNIGKHSWYY